MDWYQVVFEMIDLRSFSNLWYWIAVAVVWSSASHWIIGVPFDMMQQARRRGGQAERDFEDLVRINCRRILQIVDVAGSWLLGLVSFTLTALGIIGFLYGVEFAQAVFLLAFPMSFVGLASVRTARRIRETEARGEPLYARMRRHRLVTQLIGVVAIFVTALWGMIQNISIGPFVG